MKKMELKFLNLKDMKKKVIDNSLFELKKILILIYKANYKDLRKALKDFENDIKNKLC